MTTCRNFAAALGLIALTLLALNGTAVAEPQLERLVAAEQTLSRKIERTQRRLNRDQKQLNRAAHEHEHERSCARATVNRERRNLCADRSDDIERGLDRLSREVEKLARDADRLNQLSKKITRWQRRTQKQRDKLSRRLAQAEARLSDYEQRIATLTVLIHEVEGATTAGRRDQAEDHRAKLDRAKRLHARLNRKRDKYRAALAALGSG